MTFVPASTVVPATEPFGRIYSTCHNALVTLGAFFDANGVGLPDERFVSSGIVPYDSELVAVEVTLVRPGRPGIPALQAVEAGTTYSIEVDVHIIRAIETTAQLDDAGNLPTDEGKDGAAQVVLRDMWLLDQCVLTGTAEGHAGDPGDLQAAPFRGSMIQQIAPYGPAGDLMGIVAHLVLQLV